MGEADVTNPIPYSYDAQNGFNIHNKDQGIAGWNVEDSSTSSNTYWQRRLWRNLVNGYTLGKAIQIVTSRGNPVGGNLEDLKRFQRAIPPIAFGDMNMKLHGVYVPKGVSARTQPSGNQLTDWWWIESNTQDNSPYPNGTNAQ